MIWFTADHHFNHENILKYQPNREFENIWEHDSELVKRWNDKIDPDDTVYYLGDFTLQGVNTFKATIAKLNGHIKFIPGGHDYRWFKMYFEAGNRIEYLPPLYSLEIPRANEKYPQVIVLCHYAMKVWDRSHYGSLHLFGHSHGKLEGTEKSMDVGVDTNDFYPYSLNEIRERLNA